MKSIRKSSKEDKQQKFYDRMKKSVEAVSSTCAEAEVVSVQNHVEAVTIADSQNNIEALNNLITQAKANIFELYCVMGLELATLKYLSYVKKCNSCELANDKYVVLSCSTCRKLKSNARNITQFFQFCRHNLAVNGSNDWINFLINIGRLSKELDKFKLVTISLNELKNNISWLRKFMLADAAFWQA